MKRQKVEISEEFEKILMSHGCVYQSWEDGEPQKVYETYCMLPQWFKKDSLGNWWVIQENDLPKHVYEDTKTFEIEELQKELNIFRRAIK